MAKKQVGGTPATQALTAAGVAFTLHAYHAPANRPADHDADRHGYGVEAAEALGVDPSRMFKTLIAELTGDPHELVVAVVPVAGHLDLKALAAVLGAKRAAMAEPAAAIRSSGYVLGGISPLAQRTRLRTVVDASALTYPTVFVSAGRRGLQVELGPADLVSSTSAVVAPVAG